MRSEWFCSNAYNTVYYKGVGKGGGGGWARYYVYKQLPQKDIQMKTRMENSFHVVTRPKINV